MKKPEYSTTRRVIKADPQEIAGLVKQSNKPEDKFETVLFLPEGENRQGEGGLRTKGYFKVGGIIPNVPVASRAKIGHCERGETIHHEDTSPLTEQDPSAEAKPLITVVTVVFNGEKFLEETILSVINQTYDNVEYIIIDGGSTDGTLDIIKKYEHAIDYWVSEKDKGIYDAMNKGIKLAMGDWINFMNAGDTLFKIPHFDKDLLGVSLVYAKTKLGDRKVLSCNEKLSFNDFSFGMVVCHQACFYVKGFYKTHDYDCSFKICADQKFTAQALTYGNALFVNDVICRYIDGGFSAQQDKNIFIERLRLNKEMGFKIYPVYHSYIRAKLVSVREFLWKVVHA